MKLKGFTQFVNEAAASAEEATKLQAAINAEAAATAAPQATTVTPIPPNNDYKISVINLGGKGAIRVVGDKGARDYKLSISSIIYSGPIIPTKFWRSSKNNSYYIATNADQTQKLSQADVDKFLTAYKTDSKKMTIPGTLADLTLIRTWDFS